MTDITSCTFYQPNLTAVEPGKCSSAVSKKRKISLLPICHRKVEAEFVASKTNWMMALLAKIRHTEEKI